MSTIHAPAPHNLLCFCTKHVSVSDTLDILRTCHYIEKTKVLFIKIPLILNTFLLETCYLFLKLKINTKDAYK